MKYLILALITLNTTVFAEEKTMCGYFAQDGESMTGPEKSWLEVRGRGNVTLKFPGRTPYMSEGMQYCCFGEYTKSINTLEVKTGCEEQ